MGSVDVQLLLTRTQAEKQRLQRAKSAQQLRIQPLHALMCRASPTHAVGGRASVGHKEEKGDCGLKFSQALILGVPAPRAVVLAPLYRILLRAGTYDHV